MAANGKSIAKKVAKERINILYDRARASLHTDRTLSREYTKTLMDISDHYKVRLPPEMRAGICKECMLPLVHGENLQIRVLARQKRRIYRCTECGNTNTLKMSS